MPHAVKIDRPRSVDLSEIPQGAPDGTDKDEALERTAELGKELSELQETLFYAGKHALLIVLQGMDTSGKDGTIRHLLNFSNVQSTRVAAFKVPTPNELAHDFLWRVHDHTPGKGCITVFNRSHYEDVLVVRVHDLVPKDVWKRRYDHINAFERLVSDSGTLILKFFLHISKEEQEERLLEREQDVEKAWKLSVGDWKERELWKDYQEAYEDAIGKCAAPEAPWFIVPANQKWYRNLAVTEAVVEALRPLKDGWLRSLDEVGKKAKAELEQYRSTTS
ncbi:MAG: polyphosphate kinase 2 family protein [Armatimonadetes bacterium]|nr:polyphosphate kinase 2 family protein [Armatimonadota bacterium]